MVTTASRNNEVAQVVVQFVQDELVTYLERTRPASAAVQAAMAENGTVEDRHIEAARGVSAVLLDETGFNMGIRLCERLIVNKERLRSQRDCVKFICKEFWLNLFGKQADRLQTNRKGGYVVLDNNFLPLRHILKGQLEKPVCTVLPPVTENEPTSRQAAHSSASLIHVCGIIRGALFNLGYSSVITAESERSPVCSFKIDLDQHCGEVH